MHAERFASEPGTRDAVHGPFWSNYFASVKELRGWDDGDGFFTSYIGHPMEGSVFAFIEVQNDPRYRELRFNQGRDYWTSRLRAAAYSAVWSTLWTMGPVSEASLGNVQLHSSPGFVDLVVTPTLGLGWAIGEDVIDRYLIAPLEERTANRLLLLLARGVGNPTRSFAKLLSGQQPWVRDGRPGLFGANFVARSEAVLARKAGDSDDPPTAFAAPVSARAFPARDAPAEIAASTHYETFLGGGSCIGGGGSGAVRIAPAWQVVAEVSGCLIVNMPVNQSADSLLYVAGLRWTPPTARLISPHLQFEAGGRKVTQDNLDPTLRTTLQSEWDAGKLPHYPLRSDYSTQNSANGFALLAGGGMDINVAPALTVRVANFEYTRSFVPVVNGVDASHGVRFSAGLVLHIGNW